jgi:hypothetical protein
MPEQSTLSAEDAKLVTLARASRARNSSAEGAAVRDQDGRTYVATSVDLPSLRLSALQTAVAMAVSSGASSLEAAAVVSDTVSDTYRSGGSDTGTGSDTGSGSDTVGDPDTAPGVRAVRDLAGSGIVVHLADAAGRPRAMVRT